MGIIKIIKLSWCKKILYTFLPIPSGHIIFIISLHKNLDKSIIQGLLHKRIIQFLCNKKRIQFHGKMKIIRQKKGQKSSIIRLCSKSCIIHLCSKNRIICSGHNMSCFFGINKDVYNIAIQGLNSV